jgi:hypothetical protein
MNFDIKNFQTRLFGQAVMAFLAPVAFSLFYDYFTTKRSPIATTRRQLLTQFSIVDEDNNTNSVDLPEQEDSSVGTWSALGLQRPVVIAMVGLPARGKSYIVKMLLRYLRWIGFECDVFNVGSYRRLHGLCGINADFFSASNSDAAKSREEMAMAVQDLMYLWLKNGEQYVASRRMLLMLLI